MGSMKEAEVQVGVLMNNVGRNTQKGWSIHVEQCAKQEEP